MDPKNKKNYPFNDDTLEDTLKVTSANDCTGLIPSAPQSDAEADAYTDLYDIPNSKNKEGK